MATSRSILRFSMLIIYRRPPASFCARCAVRFELHSLRESTGGQWWTRFARLTRAIWQNLNYVEQKRFLRHLRGFWDIHRHRCAPQVMAVKEQLEAEKRLISHRGHILDLRPVEDHVEVTYRPRG